MNFEEFEKLYIEGKIIPSKLGIEKVKEFLSRTIYQMAFHTDECHPEKIDDSLAISQWHVLLKLIKLPNKQMPDKELYEIID